MQLAAIVEAGGFTEAAIMMGTTQPSISRTVALLEKRLGEPLFLRQHRPVQPTAICITLARQGETVLAAARKASESVEQFRQGEEGAIRVAGTPFFMDALVSGLIADYQSKYTRVRVDQKHAYGSELITMIRSAQVDLAICPIDPMNQDADMEFTELIQARNVIACRADHPLLHHRRISPAHLLEYPWIAPPPSSPLHADLRSALSSMGTDKIRIAYSCDSSGGVLNYLKRSDCLTVLPHGVVFSQRKSGEISALPLKLDHPQRYIGLMRSRLLARTPTLDRFADYLSSSFNELKDQIRRHEQIVIWGG